MPRSTYHGVIYDFQPYIFSATAMSAAWNDGIAIVQNNVTTVIGSATALSASDPLLSRYDVIASDSAGNVTVFQGTSSDNPILPDYSGVISGAFLVPAGSTAPSAVQDLRVFVDIPSPAHTLIYTNGGTTAASADPGAGFFTMNTLANTAISAMYVSYKAFSYPFVKNFLKPATGTVPTRYLRIYQRSSPNVFWVGEVTSFTDNGSYATLGITYVYSSAGTQFTVGLDTADVVFTWEPATTIQTANGTQSMTADVTMTNANQFYDGPSTGSIGINGWSVVLGGQVCVLAGASGDKITAKLTDGTNNYSEVEEVGSNVTAVTLTFSPIIVPMSAALNFKISVASSGTGASIKKAATANSSGNLASQITYFRIQ